MQLSLIKKSDETKAVAYAIARLVYAETRASSLPAVEALTSMINNISVSAGKNFTEIISDSDMFESLNKDSDHHKYLSTDVSNRGFQMCVRVVNRMLHGALPDSCCGATKFHRVNRLPDWAVARGYIADIDGLLFYL